MYLRQLFFFFCSFHFFIPTRDIASVKRPLTGKHWKKLTPWTRQLLLHSLRISIKKMISLQFRCQGQNLSDIRIRCCRFPVFVSREQPTGQRHTMILCWPLVQKKTTGCKDSLFTKKSK